MTHLKQGDKAPIFSGKDQNGNAISSADFAGKRYVVYFYPKDMTPGCTTQACNLRDNYDALGKAGISIIGVSADSETSHQKFITKYELPFPLIADVDLSVIKAFGVWGPKKFMGKNYDGIHRSTFLVNEDGNIQAVISKPNTKSHAEEILELF
jgi:thioredoxin-dependent peroxiredoxin